ncbi:glycosyltransferase [Pelosinus sp. IPA-1]|uniref:glycosyltransferase n=1 Tax=Pelosinus sp. IPA-1 TaxID=3029569 RepID=UPI0024361928|nr:glycosyltransferase [Pelosinus sp. IPA-1]GMB01657.1 putative glycosyltransferase EpsH [Pelosinus sp. IPA-1]
MNIKVSIVVPVFNAKQYLDHCLESLRSQTLDEIEILVIDDGSTDESVAIISEYSQKDSRIKLICKENSGVSDTRNVGLIEAKGQYIGFVDSDDWIEPKMYESMYRQAIALNVDIVRCGLTMNREDSSLIEEITLPYEQEIPYKNGDIWSKFIRMLIGTSFTEANLRYDKALAGYSCVHLYNRKFLLSYNMKFDTQLKVYEDLLFNLTAYSHAKAVGIMNKLYYHYRQNSLSACNRYKPDLEHNQDLMVNHITNFIKEHKLDEEYTKALSYRIFFDTLWAVSNIFSRYNHESWKTKSKRVQNLFSKEHVRNSFFTLKSSGLSLPKRLLHLIIKSRLYSLLSVLYFAKGKMNDRSVCRNG